MPSSVPAGHLPLKSVGKARGWLPCHFKTLFTTYLPSTLIKGEGVSNADR
jgi:hypothetical protein